MINPIQTVIMDDERSILGLHGTVLSERGTNFNATKIQAKKAK